MAKVIKHSDLVADDAVKRIASDVDVLTKKIIGLNKELKKTKEGFDSTKTIKSAKDLERFGKGVESVNALEKERIKTAKEFETLQAKTINGLSKQSKENVKLKVSIAEQNKVTKQQAREALNLVGAYERESKALTALKKRFKDLAVQNKENTKEGKALINQITTLDKRLKKVDKTVGENHRTIGGYTDGIKEAAGASGLFGKILGPLAAVQGTLNALMKKSTAENEANAAAVQANAVSTKKLSIAQRASAVATGIGTKALKVFKLALASTGIGLLVVALGSLIAFFSRSQKGIDFLSVKMAGLGAAVDVIIDAFAAFGEVIFDVFSKPEKIIEELVKFIKKIPKLVLDNIVNRFKAFGVILQAIVDRDLKALGNGFIQLGTGVTDFSDKATAAIDALKESADKAAEAIKKSADEMARKLALAEKLKALTIELTREEKLFEAQQAAAITRIKELNLISRDKLKADEIRIKALQDANEIEVALAIEQEALADRALAASLDSLSADQQRLKLMPEQLKFINQIKNGQIDAADAVQQAADFTISSAEGEAALFEIVDKVVAQEQAKQNLLDKQATTIKKLSALEQLIANKNSTTFARQAQATRELSKDENKATEERIELLKEAARLEILSFKARSDANIINAEETAAARIQIEAKLQAAIQKLLKKTNEVRKEDVTEKEDEDINDAIIKGIAERNKAEKEAADEREALRLKEKQEAIALATQVTAITEDALNKQSEARLQSLDSEISRREASIARMSEKSQGEITEGIAFEEAELEKARLKQQQEEEKAAKRARLISAGQVLMNQLAKSDEKGASAIAEALATSLGGLLLAETIAGSAFEGVDDTGGRGNVDSRGGKNWTLHPHEQVDSLADRKKKADPITGKLRTRKEITDIVQEYDRGSTWAFMPQMSRLKEDIPAQKAEAQTKAIVQSNDEVIQAIKDNRVNINYEWNSLNEAIETQIIGVRKTITKHKYEPLKKIK